jgi:hypothetical protein
MILKGRQGEIQGGLSNFNEGSKIKERICLIICTKYTRFIMDTSEEIEH